MQELEKILEEINKRIDRSMLYSYQHAEGLREAKGIILKHMNNGWIPVEERLPDESLNSVIGWDEYRERCCFVQYYAGKWALRADREPIKITHWRPSPDRPERSEE